MVFRQERAYIDEFEPALASGWLGLLDRHLQQWTENFGRMFIAEVDGDAVGYYFWQPDGTQAILASICVLAAHRRTGIGAALLKHFETDARHNGYRVLALGVLRGNPAQTLYERAGYQYLRDEGQYACYELATVDR
jgi:GNAT superfamily N-acetyltransferase